MSDTTADLARSLRADALLTLAGLRGVPWDEAVARVRACVLEVLRKRFPDAEGLEALVEAHVREGANGLRLDIDALAAELLGGVPTERGLGPAR